MGFLTTLKTITPEEKVYIDNLIENLSEDEQEMFLAKYSLNRKNIIVFLMLILPSFFCLPGFHRFYVRDYMMGAAHLFTMGFCWIGSIVDAINCRKIVTKQNMMIAEGLVTEVRNKYALASKGRY